MNAFPDIQAIIVHNQLVYNLVSMEYALHQIRAHATKDGLIQIVLLLFANKLAEMEVRDERTEEILI